METYSFENLKKELIIYTVQEGWKKNYKEKQKNVIQISIKKHVPNKKFSTTIKPLLWKKLRQSKAFL